MATALLRTKPKESEAQATYEPNFEIYPYEYVSVCNESVQHRHSDQMQRWVEDVLADSPTRDM